MVHKDQKPHESRTRLLDATLKVVRTKGYTATRIEDICAAAELTKGSFFHHFKSKDDLALAAVEHWDALTSRLFAEAPYHRPADPLGRVLAYIDFRKTLLAGELPEITCFAGTIIQETYLTHPELRDACERNISGHVNTLQGDFREAILQYGVAGQLTADSLALHTQTVIQGCVYLGQALSVGFILWFGFQLRLQRFIQTRPSGFRAGSFFDVTPKGRNEVGPYHALGDWARPKNMYGKGGFVESTGRYHPPTCECSVHR